MINILACLCGSWSSNSANKLSYCLNAAYYSQKCFSLGHGATAFVWLNFRYCLWYRVFWVPWRTVQTQSWTIMRGSFSNLLLLEPVIASHVCSLSPEIRIKWNPCWYISVVLTFMGMPLQIFGKGSLFGPYTPLQQLDILADVGTKSYIVGSTNSLLLQQKDRYSDILINACASPPPPSLCCHILTHSINSLTSTQSISHHHLCGLHYT